MLKKILLCCLCLWLITDCLQANQSGERKSKTQKHSTSRDDMKIPIYEENQSISTDTIIKNNFQSPQNSLQQQDKNIEKIINQLRSSEDYLRILYYISIGLNILIISLLVFLVIVLRKVEFHKWYSELTYLKNNLFRDNKLNCEALRFFPQFSETLRKLVSDNRSIQEAVYNINKKIENLAGSIPQAFFSGSEPESQIIRVKYIGEIASRQTFSRHAVPEYFYIEKKDGKWRLYIEENILNKRPSQEYEVLLSKFFEIIKCSNPHRYELLESAIIDWEETKDEGYLRTKGKIKHVEQN